MPTGQVEWFNEAKGIGFIEDECGMEIPFQVSDVREPRVLRRGDRVAFDVTEGRKGPRAVNIAVI